MIARLLLPVVCHRAHACLECVVGREAQLVADGVEGQEIIIAAGVVSAAQTITFNDSNTLTLSSNGQQGHLIFTGGDWIEYVPVIGAVFA